MERQDLLDRMANAFGQSESDSRARSHLAPLELQSYLKEEKLFKDEPPVSRSGGVFKRGKTFAFVWKMHLLKSGAAVEQFQAAAQRRWNTIGDLRSKMF